MSRYLTAAGLQALEARLTERDVAILRQVVGLRFVSGSQLTRLHFGGASATEARAARRALLRLTKLDVLARLPRPVGGVRAGSGGFVYHLGNAGHGLAVRRGWQPERRRRRSQTPGQLFLAHTLLVAELHTRLVEGDRSRRFELLELSAEPACWRELGGFGNQRDWLKPDSYARLGIGDFEDSYFFEVDRGTEGSRTIERQLERYVRHHRSGREQAERGVFPRTLWLATSPERVGVIASSVQRLPTPSRELFRVAHFDDALDMIGNAN